MQIPWSHFTTHIKTDFQKGLDYFLFLKNFLCYLTLYSDVTDIFQEFHTFPPFQCSLDQPVTNGRAVFPPQCTIPVTYHIFLEGISFFHIWQYLPPQGEGLGPFSNCFVNTAFPGEGSQLSGFTAHWVQSTDLVIQELEQQGHKVLSWMMAEVFSHILQLTHS